MPTATIYASAGDGEVRGPSAPADWSAARSASTGSSADYTSTQSFGAYVSRNAGDWSSLAIARGYLPFDLSGIPSGSVISDITLTVKPYAVWTGADGSLCVCSSTQSSASSLATSDYGNSGTTEYASRTLFSAFTAGTAETITLNATAIAAATVGASGKLYISLRASQDLDNSQPTNFQFSGIGIDYSEFSGTGSDPYLTVTYTPGRTTSDAWAWSDTADPSYWRAARVARSVKAAGASTTLSGSHTFPTGTVTVSSTSGFASSGTFVVVDTVTPPYAQTTVTYTGTTSTTFTGCTGGSGTFGTNTAVCAPDAENHFPSIVVLDSTTTPAMMVSYHQHAAHSAKNGSVKYKKSTNGGLTWGSEGTIQASPVNGSSYGIFGHNLFRCSNGTLIATWYESSPSSGTGGHAKWEYETLSYSSRSTDDGVTWDTPVAIPTQYGLDYMAVGITGMVEYGGNVYVTAYGLDSGYNTDSPNHHYSKLLKTTDKGATTGNWSVVGTIATTTQTDGRANGEASLCILPDGTWLSHLRCEVTGTYTHLDRYQAISTDHGVTWSGHTRIAQYLANSADTIRRQSGLILTQGAEMTGSGRSGTTEGQIITLFTADYNSWPSDQYRVEGAAGYSYNGSRFAAPTAVGAFDAVNVYAYENGAQSAASVTFQWYEIPGVRVSTDSWAWTDSVARTLTLPKTTSDSWAWTDSATKTVQRATSDSWAWSDSATRSAPKSRSTGDTWTWADAATGALLTPTTYLRTTADSWAWSDAAGPAAAATDATAVERRHRATRRPRRGGEW